MSSDGLYYKINFLGGMEAGRSHEVDRSVGALARSCAMWHHDVLTKGYDCSAIVVMAFLGCLGAIARPTEGRRMDGRTDA